ncbi:MAG: SDR family oxidoreductase [Chloroflexi bacterium]|nr:SDR family oxidoreductase [Chloroflexota bacterium]
MEPQHLYPISGPGGLEGQVAIVTGAARGIGRACAAALARVGAVVVALDLQPCDETLSAVRQLDDRSTSSRVDVTRRSDVEACITGIVRQYGRIDVLVNNAGVAARMSLEATTDELWQRDLGVVLTGTYLMTQAVYPAMVRQRCGRIVNVSSISGKIGGAVSKAGDAADALAGRTGPAYAAAKGGVLAFTRWVAKDAGRHGIRCNAVCPGPIETEMTRGYDYSVANQPIPRLGQPEDVAEAVLFLASPASSFITGQALNVDGGIVMD